MMWFYYISNIKKIVYILFFLTSFNGIAQEFADKKYYLVDSLVLENLTIEDKELLNSSLITYHKTKNDTSKINALNRICENMMHDDWIKYQKHQYQLIENELTVNVTDELLYLKAKALNNLGYWENEYNGNSEKALTKYYECIKLCKQLEDKDNIIPNCLNNIANVYEHKGNIIYALKFYHLSLNYMEKAKDAIGMGNVLNNLATIYLKQEDFKNAHKYFYKAANSYNEGGYLSGEALILGNLGASQYNQGEYQKSLSNYERALKIHIDLGNQKGMGTILNNIGGYYLKIGEYETALNYRLKSYETRKLSKDTRGQLISLDGIAAIYLELNEYKLAEKYGQEAYQIADKLEFPDELSRSCKTLSKVYEKQGKGLKALEMYKIHVIMKDSINNEATQKASIRQQTKYEFEKAQIVKENEVKEQARLEAEATSRRNNLQYSLIFLGILVLFGIVLSLGFIKVSPNIAEGMIFFAFLILFEFLLVFTEPYLEQYTNGEPMYNLLANSILALLIFPVHAILEKLLKKSIVK